MCEPTKLARIHSPIRIQKTTKSLGHLVWPTIKIEASNPISWELEGDEWPSEVTQKKCKPTHHFEFGMVPSVHSKSAAKLSLVGLGIGQH